MFLSKFTKNFNFNRFREPILLFMVFFLPGYIGQTRAVDGSAFNSVYFNIYYLITVLPQIMLILYLIDGKPETSREFYGIGHIKMSDITHGLLYFPAVIIMVMITGLISFLITGADYNTAAGLPVWNLNRGEMIPMVFITCLATGYSEELFFRSYLLTELQSTFQPYTAVAVGAFIFALGHIYQGIPGFVGTLAIGLFLGIMFIRRRNLHAIAIAHGLYNFSILMLTFVINT